MTEEELKKYEATAHHGLGLSLKTPDALSLIALARIGLAASKNGTAQRRLIGNNWDSFSTLPKPGGDATSKHHDWQISDSSLYDFKCRNCGSTDRSKDADLPCTKPGGE